MKVNNMQGTQGNKYDWRKHPKGWKYKKDIKDPRYIKDRDEMLKEHGNGWWDEVSYRPHVHKIKPKHGR